MSDPTVVVFTVEPPQSADMEGTAEHPVPLEISAMADPGSAHSPMSPDDQVSDKHVGLSVDLHTTGGTTPQS